jgi:hypothetical protein
MSGLFQYMQRDGQACPDLPKTVSVPYTLRVGQTTPSVPALAFPFASSAP